MRTSITLLFASALVSCALDPWDGCYCLDGACDNVAGCGDEAGDEAGGQNGCKRTLDQRGFIGDANSGCNQTWIEIMAYFGRSAQKTDVSLDDCRYVVEGEPGDVVTQPMFHCYAGLLYPEFVDPAECMYCPQLDPAVPAEVASTIQSTFGNDGYWLCYPTKSEWEDAKLLGAIAPLDGGTPRCDLIPPPPGKAWSYTEPVWAPWGVSCIDGGQQCAPICRDGDSLAELWDLDGLFLNPLDYSEHEPTCTGEPLVAVTHPTLGVFYEGTTLEINGFDPPWPPNGASWHDSLWDLLADGLSCAGLDCTATLALVDHALTFPDDLRGGMPYEARIELSGAIEVEILGCEAPSLCASLGLDPGDVLTGVGNQTITPTLAASLVRDLASAVSIGQSMEFTIQVSRASGTVETFTIRLVP